MTENDPSTPDFLNQITAIIEKNMANEQFGVSELADAMSMSRSNLLRKVKKETKLSVSQLINQERLKKAMEILRKSSLNVSEVSHQVGFNSVSYFIKCFREFYGYPPGEVGKRSPEEPVLTEQPAGKPRVLLISLAVAIVALVVVLFFFNMWPFRSGPVTPKSIAVLPFKNESTDSSNVYIINGLMESTLSNLQKIKDIRVVSRTSSEKYRNTTKSIPEIARELNVGYFVEGSGQKMGDRILLHVQLIEASTDRHLWAGEYKRETKDIFQLQREIARDIAEEIKVAITPEEAERIAKRPTADLEAYDLFMQAKEVQSKGGDENLLKAVDLFKSATEKDSQFAMAYGEIAITYYYIDLFHAEKKYQTEIDQYADKAILHDPKLGESLVSKALSYISKKEYASALPYLQKAVEYNPNSSSVVGLLTDFYAFFEPNTNMYLRYALKGIQLNVAAMDSVSASNTFLRLGNALIQNGFVDESLHYIDKSIEYNPKNPFSKYLRAFVAHATRGDLVKAREALIVEYNKDTSRFDILQDIGKLSYHMKDFDGAFRYYKKFDDFRQSHKLNVYQHENLVIGYVFAKKNYIEKSKELVKSYKEFLDGDKSIYRNLGLSSYYIYSGDNKKGLEYLKLFSKEDNVQYWTILFIESDPILESVLTKPEFKVQIDQIKSRFWKSHDALKLTLTEKDLLN